MVCISTRIESWLRVDVHCPLRTSPIGAPWDIWSDGRCAMACPAFTCTICADLANPDIGGDPIADRLKTLGAAMAASGAVAFTTSRDLRQRRGVKTSWLLTRVQITIDDLSPGYDALQSEGTCDNGGARPHRLGQHRLPARLTRTRSVRLHKQYRADNYARRCGSPLRAKPRNNWPPRSRS